MRSLSNTLHCCLPGLAFLALLVCPAIHCSGVQGPSACPAKIHQLKSAAPLSSLVKDEQKKILHALSDDMAEMAEVDIASTERSKSEYRQYFAGRLQFERVQQVSSKEQLLFVRYKSSTVCGPYENCPVWIISLSESRARSMVPWQKELGTSAGGGWGVAIGSHANSQYPALILLTHLSSTETGLACYSESNQQYRRVPCSPECTHWMQYAAEQ